MPNKTFSASGLKLVFEESSQEAIVHCDGRITAASSEMLQREIAGNLIPISRGKVAAVNTRIVLDLSRVTYVDNVGLEALLRIWTASQSKCCSVEIINRGPQTLKRWSWLRLDRAFRRMLALFEWSSAGRRSVEVDIR